MSADYRDPDKPPSKGLDFFDGERWGEPPGGLNSTGPELESYHAAVKAEQERALHPAIKRMLVREPTAEQQAAWRLAPGIEAGFLNFEGSPPDLVDAIAGQLLDKGDDVNLRARVLDLAAKWAALGGDGTRSARDYMYFYCASELRGLALQAAPATITMSVMVDGEVLATTVAEPVTHETAERPWVDEELEQHRDAQQGRLAEMLGPEAFADLQGRPVTRTLTPAELEAQSLPRDHTIARLPGDGFAYDSAAGKLTPCEPEYRMLDAIFSPENMETLRGAPCVRSVEADADGLGVTVTASEPEGSS